MIRALILMAAAPLAACAALKGGDQPVTMRLSPHFAAAATTPMPGPSFAVAQAQARGVTGALRYAYVDAAAPGEVRQAATLFWEEPPTVTLSRALVAGLRARFLTVTGPNLSLAADRRVVAVLDRFEEVTGEGAGGAQAVVAFDVTQVAGGKAVGAGRYCATRPIGSAAGTARAAAFAQAIEQAVTAFVQDAAAGTVSTASC